VPCISQTDHSSVVGILFCIGILTVMNTLKTFLFILSAMMLNYEPEEEPPEALGANSSRAPSSGTW
jgi:hypothetical protein